MKNWSTTKKILVVLAVVIIAALIINGVMDYKKAKKEADVNRIANRVGEAVQNIKSSQDMSGDQLAAAIRDNLSKQPVSEIGVKFYQPQY